jgi:coenzyme F420-0:L-glutamate ligase/coenzyme F420-1:gamma-L-glutamate ligase
MNLTLTALPGLPEIKAGDDLAVLIQDGLVKADIQLQRGDVLGLAQKVVSKAEGRLVDLSTVLPSREALALAIEVEKDPRIVELILQESREIVRKRPGLLLVEHRLGFICANAGIDQSNVKGSTDWALLLPLDPDGSAERIRTKLENASGTQIGVLVIDSHGRAWRNGTVGVTIGLSGLPGVVDLRGRADRQGYTLKATDVGAADELAAAASLLMGQAAEGTPVVHARGFPYRLREAALDELLRPKDQDLFR